MLQRTVSRPYTENEHEKRYWTGKIEPGVVPGMVRPNGVRETFNAQKLCVDGLQPALWRGTAVSLVRMFDKAIATKAVGGWLLLPLATHATPGGRKRSLECGAVVLTNNHFK